MNPSRRATLKSAAGLLTVFTLPASLAQPGYPNALIKVVIPTPAGGGHDAMMRVIGEKLTASWGQPVIVESKPGASGAIAATTVAKAPPDGHTLVLGYSALISNVVLMPNPGYKLEELAPVCMLALTPIAIGVRSSLGVKTLAEYVTLAKSRPGKLTYGSYGQGSGGHFVGELLNGAAGIDVTHVPYKGEAPAIQDLLGGQIDAAITSVGAVSRYPDKIVPLAVSSPQRFVRYKDVPTFAETGYPSVNMPGWGALFAPAATPQPIVDKVAAEMARILALPDVPPRLHELGFDPLPWGPARLRTFMTEQMAQTRKLVESGRVKL
ncbi:Bug family tripartite tricarboxylate transporter substrate binding protein [Piscinibacter koreensis]|uniref:Tripartite tricarboxylate transporter substrate binding protein n=1 Tax=Piscinibacter koreensis TaxID=2742824 RepID=A0A7Y6NMW8_9BURK|nr:tripartite tricarboxylate transporter substrate binding protein [Schlegelella koreensis]NUZ06090.1 tripartite tricarboxylate transporter substrate binding protein [Schlegelella koreensis]